MFKKIILNTQEYAVEYYKRNGDTVIVLGGEEFVFNGQELHGEYLPESRQLSIPGQEIIEIYPAQKESVQKEGDLLAPMPGVVVALYTSPGARVAAGETLMVLEAMKMQHEITAQQDGVIKEVFFAEGEQVKAQDLLVEMES